MTHNTSLVETIVLTDADDFSEAFIAPQINVAIQESVLKIAKKRIRSIAPHLLILDCRQPANQRVFLPLAAYTKTQLGYAHCHILCIAETSDAQSAADAEFVDEWQLLTQTQPAHIANRISKAYTHIHHMLLEQQQLDAQSRLLMCVTRFSHHRQPVEQLIRDVTESLGNFCYAAKTSIVYRQRIEMPVSHSTDINSFETFTTPPPWMETIAANALNCNAPKIELLEASAHVDAMNTALRESIGSYIVFPLKVYGESLAGIVCFITEDAMRLVSTQHLNVMRDVAEQLKLVLEQRSAESRLKAQYQRLKATMEELNTTKEQLVHTEKMASVGQIAAGLAHEINNPLSFVLGNFSPLNEYVETLVKMLDMHDQLMQSMNSDAQHTEIKTKIAEFKEDSEIDYIVEDIQAIVNDSRDGLLRVRDIISDLSSFSRKQNLETQVVNIAELIDEALRLLKYEIADDICIQNQIDTAIRLTSHRGFIQQVITNLVKNAAQALNTNHNRSNDDAALTSSSVNSTKMITLNASIEAEKLLHIDVEDNGPGIPSEQLQKIFEPFFTTKDVGSGTGLGLSVCSNLAQKMGGTLTASSTLGESTCFRLSLPLQHE